MKTKRTVVIMAGGSGERFYPLSRRRKPKQLLALVDPNKSMIEESIERVADIIAFEDMYVVTSVVLQDAIRATLPQIPAQNIIAEPAKRNTAPCLALAAAVIAERYSADYKPEQISTAVLTADQFIADLPVFREQVTAALEHAEASGDFVTLGILPSRPETGYGYIESGDVITSDIRSVRRFREKPDRQTAEEFIKHGGFYWNSGMFFYRCDSLINGLKQHEPAIGAHIDEMRHAIGAENANVAQGAYAGIQSIFEAFPDISVDYALMERASNVAVLPSRFEWDDVGSWDSLDRTNEHDIDSNVRLGLTTTVDTKNSILVNYAKQKPVMLSVVGMDNIVVVVTEDSVMVCPKDRVQDVKKVVTQLREKGLDEWL